MSSRTVGENLAQTQHWNPDVIHTRAHPFKTTVCGAEVGSLPPPPQLRRQGLPDLLRISDTPLGGTAYGTVRLQADGGVDLDFQVGQRGDCGRQGKH